MRLKISVLLILFIGLYMSTAFAQNTEPPKNEFRAAWIATVFNLDWPSSGNLAARFQKDQLRSQLDKLKEAGINTVIFQIRTEGDALYESDIEPWSRYLTGEEGTPPDPFYDPLKFAIEEAHKRGMELHAWLNPYRALTVVPSDFSQKQNTASDIPQHLQDHLTRFYDANQESRMYKGTEERDSMHVANKHPEWLFVMNDAIAIMNPGLPEVMEYNLKVVMDVVNRYDVDGIHFDDYFYPYPPNHMGSSSENQALDDSTFAKYPRGFDNKDDWRRNNIDLFVEMVHDSIQVVKPWVKFGISPFGIWKNGVPNGISGMDAYSVIYGDGIAWLENQTIDYITPQLYWAFTRFGTGQDYGKLADWWAEQATVNGRHIYPGHGLYRTSSSSFSNTLFDADEIPRQIRHNRNNENINGSVFFRSRNITTYSSKGFADSLKNNYYRYPALQPPMEWMSDAKPGSPENFAAIKGDVEYQIQLSWDRPEDDQLAKSSSFTDSLLKYAVYRVESASPPDALQAMANPANLVTVTGETSYEDEAPPSEDDYYYFVTAASRNNIESDPSEAVNVGVVVSNEEDPAIVNGYRLSQNYPNPFNPTTQINFQLAEPAHASLKVYDMIGREVAVLIQENRSAGAHSVTFDASSLSSGIYIYRLEAAGTTLTKKMTLIK